RDQSPQSIAPTSSKADAWAAYLTEDIKSTRGGVVGLLLRLPPQQMAIAQDLGSAAAARFDLRWQTIRRTMARYRLAVVREQSTWFAAPAMESLSEESLGFIADMRRQAANLTTELAHLGEQSTNQTSGANRRVELQGLVPLPGSRIARPYQITAGLHV